MGENKNIELVNIRTLTLILLATISFAITLRADSTYFVNNNVVIDPNNQDGTQLLPFNKIQTAINTAKHNDSIIVCPGTYTENIRFKNRNITVSSAAPDDFEIVEQTIISGYVLFQGQETSDCNLKGFKISHKDSGWILGYDSFAVIDPNFPPEDPGQQYTKATISNCLITGNSPCDAFIIAYCDGLIKNCLIADNGIADDCQGLSPAVLNCHGVFENCTIATNPAGIAVGQGQAMTIKNSIVYNNNSFTSQIDVAAGGEVHISYSNIQDGEAGITGSGTVVWGLGNIDVDPYFHEIGSGDFFGNMPQGDYHLKSKIGRFDPETQSWVNDSQNSRCIATGDPKSDFSNEPSPNKSRVNMGTYGNTAQASKAAGNIEWTGEGDVDGAGDLLWTDGDNWKSGTAPSSVDKTYHYGLDTDDPNAPAVIKTGDAVTIEDLHLGYAGYAAILVDGGSFTVNDETEMGLGGYDAEGVFEITSGTAHFDDYVLLAGGDKTSGTFNVLGGSVTTGDFMLTQEDKINVSISVQVGNGTGAATLTIQDDLILGTAGTQSPNYEDGSPKNANTVLDGGGDGITIGIDGTLIVNGNFEINDDEFFISLEGGTLKVKTTGIQAEADGFIVTNIVGYDGTDDVTSEVVGVYTIYTSIYADGCEAAKGEGYDVAAALSIGDTNHDCQVNLADFAVMAENWLNGDCLDDLATMASNWLADKSL